MRRREFIWFLGSAAAVSPLLARAQQRPRRRIGVLMNLTSDDPEAQTRIAGFMQGLQELGWAVGRNVRVDYRWGGRHRLPALYPFSYYVNSGGLIGYGPDSVDQYRRAASYVDRILKGEEPADLPVQTPIKYALAINLKTAKSLGLVVPPALLARADEVID